jgi:hypothetical protein
MVLSFCITGSHLNSDTLWEERPKGCDRRHIDCDFARGFLS